MAPLPVPLNARHQIWANNSHGTNWISWLTFEVAAATAAAAAADDAASDDDVAAVVAVTNAAAAAAMLLLGAKGNLPLHAMNLQNNAKWTVNKLYSKLVCQVNFCSI